MNSVNAVTPETDAVIHRANNMGWSLHEAGLTDLCRKLEVQRDEFKRDAERYRWLREGNLCVYDGDSPENGLLSLRILDEDIDDAMHDRGATK